MGCWVKPAAAAAFPPTFTILAGRSEEKPCDLCVSMDYCSGMYLGGGNLQRHVSEENSDAAAPCQAREHWQLFLGHRIFQQVLSWGPCTFTLLRLHALHSLIFPRSRGIFLLATMKWYPVLPGRPRPPNLIAMAWTINTPEFYTYGTRENRQHKEQGLNSTFQSSLPVMDNPCPRQSDSHLQISFFQIFANRAT